MKRYHWWLILLLIILTAGAAVCIIRWRAWFGNNAPEPQWESDTIAYHFYAFGEDSIPGFEQIGQEWIDKKEPDILRICLLGDVHNSIEHSLYDSIYSRHPYIDCYAQTGDFVERGYFYYFQQLFHDLSGTPFEDLPILACPGNHEYTKGIPSRLSPLWCNIFREPANGPKDFIGTSYYVDFQDLRFIVINTHGLQWLHDYTRVNTWLTSVLQDTGDKFAVIMMHHPVFSCGAGRQNPLIYLAFRWTLSKADLIFAGHDHNYSRRLPFINTNSASKYYLNKVNPKDERICSGHRLYEILSIGKDTLTIQTYTLEDGTLYDEVQIIRGENGKDVVDHFIGQPELIDLPQRYEGKNNAKIRRFLNRRKHRQLVNSVE